MDNPYDYFRCGLLCCWCGRLHYDNRRLIGSNNAGKSGFKIRKLDCECKHKIDTIKSRLIYFQMVLYISLGIVIYTS